VIPRRVKCYERRGGQNKLIEGFAVSFLLDGLLVLAVLLDRLFCLTGYVFLRVIAFGKFKSDKEGVLLRSVGYLVVSLFGLFFFMG